MLRQDDDRRYNNDWPDWLCDGFKAFASVAERDRACMPGSGAGVMNVLMQLGRASESERASADNNHPSRAAAA